MKKALIYWFSFLLLLLFMTSCKSNKVVIQKEITSDAIVETLHDTVFTVEKDSSFYNALLECQNGKVAIKAVTSTGSGRKLQTPKVSIQDNQLKIDCKAEAELLFAFWKSQYVKNYKETQKPVIVNELTWFEKTQIYIGRIAILLIALYLLLLLFKFKQL
jgi:hypothetical protein